MESLETLSAMISQLNQQGYSMDLNNQLPMIHSDPEAFSINAVYRFEGPTDPGDELILYAISSPKHCLKGVLTNAFGMYADANTASIERLLYLPVDDKIQENDF